MWSCLVWDPNIFLFYHVFNILFLIIIIIFLYTYFIIVPGVILKTWILLHPQKKIGFMVYFVSLGHQLSF